MKSLAELDLPALQLDDPEFSEDPFARFAAARKQHPWLARWGELYVLTDYRSIREFMENDSKMAVGTGASVERMGAAGTPWGDFIIESVQAQTGERHKRLRDALAPAFTPREANRHRPLMRAVIEDLLDQWAPRLSFDFELFASHFPITVVCRIIGASADAVPALQPSLEVLGLGGSLDARILSRFQESFGTVDAFARDLVAERRAGRRVSEETDLLDHLLGIVAKGGITDEELFNLLVFLFVAGYDTSKNVLTLVMDLMIERPADYLRCAEDPVFCRQVVSETFRYRGVSSSPRVVLEEFDFRGFHIPQGTMFWIPWGVSGRDPAAFNHPDTFDPERPKDGSSMPFGLGPHICLGQFIARAQIEEGLHVIARRLLAPRRTGPHGWREFPGVWGIRGLPIEFTDAGRTASSSL